MVNLQVQLTQLRKPVVLKVKDPKTRDDNRVIGIIAGLVDETGLSINAEGLFQVTWKVDFVLTTKQVESAKRICKTYASMQKITIEDRQHITLVFKTGRPEALAALEANSFMECWVRDLLYLAGKRTSRQASRSPFANARTDAMRRPEPITDDLARLYFRQ